MDKMTEAQEAFLLKLLSECEPSDAVEQFKEVIPGLTKVGASVMIDKVLTFPKKKKLPTYLNPDGTRKAVAPEGMHELGDLILKVQKSATNKVYAKKLVKHGSKWSFVYAPGMVAKLGEHTKMSVESAQKFGKTFGTCCVCGRTLTQESSVAAGIGPVCSSKFA